MTGSQRRVVEAARAQIGVTRIYDPSYVRLAYPNGDVPRERGVCTDVVVRAFRAAGVDLQRVVHEDIVRDRSAYGISRPDSNIDHRRVVHLMTFFRRRGCAVPVSRDVAQWRAADLAAWRLPGGRLHIGVVCEATGGSVAPRVVHNIGAGAQSEDILFAWPLIGHYRFFRG